MRLDFQFILSSSCNYVDLYEKFVHCSSALLGNTAQIILQLGGSAWSYHLRANLPRYEMSKRSMHRGRNSEEHEIVTEKNWSAGQDSNTVLPQY